ncbi:MAG: chorismate-binding protein [Chitinophagales bacterium]
MNLHKNIAKSIQFLIENNFEFAVFRLPNSEKIKLFVDQNSEKKSGFVIQAFNVKNASIFISDDLVFENENIKISNIKSIISTEKNKDLDHKSAVHFQTQNAYQLYVKEVAETCKTENLNKGVSARIKSVAIPENFDLGIYFVKLLENYKTAFVNIFYKQEIGLWLGATPETLVKKDTRFYETVSLAGTKLISANRAWTNKEKEEQQIVTDYIKDVLIEEDCSIENDLKSKTIEAGLIAHIKTEIKFSSQKTFLELAKILHPTPAVCGFPKEEALKLIRKHEGNQRQLYAGFIGVVTENIKHLFVNLRCMRITEKDFLIYVGAGITKDSKPEKEWQETENKAQTLMRFL